MRSSLPGRISAESYNQINYQNFLQHWVLENFTITSGPLVAATTVTPTSSWTPSISFNKPVSTPLCEKLVSLESEEEREVASASTLSLMFSLARWSIMYLRRKLLKGSRACFPEYLPDSSFRFTHKFIQKLQNHNKPREVCTKSYTPPDLWRQQSWLRFRKHTRVLK